MTHFKGLVIEKEGYENADDLLSEYSENLEVAPYIYLTKDEVIERIMKNEESPQNLEYYKDNENYRNAVIKWFKWPEEKIDKDGHILSTYNRNSKYDYYSKIVEIPAWEFKKGANDELKENLSKNWDKIMEKGDDGWYKSDYYIDSYGTKERYIEAEAHNSQYACFVTPDGVWHQRGEIGWFATSDENYDSITKYNREWDEMIDYIQSHECRIYLYDFHI